MDRMDMPDVEPRARSTIAVHDDGVAQRRIDERRSFLFLTVVMVPVLTVMIVGGYGFMVWMYQVIAGPPSA